MPSRRRFLATSAAVGTAALAGCSALPFGDDPVPLGDDYPDGAYATADGGWSAYRRDGANTACAPDASPVEDPSVEWESPRFASSQRLPLRTLTVDGATVYAGGDEIRAFDLLSGDGVWTNEDAFPTRVAPDVHDGVAWTRTGQDSSAVVGLDVESGDATRRREFDADLLGEPSVAGRASYLVARTDAGGVAGVAVDEDELSGAGSVRPATWNRDLFADGTFRPATTRQVAVTSHTGEVYRFSSYGYPVWRTNLHRRPRSQPVAGASRLYVATEHGAVALDREIGEVDWEYAGVDSEAGESEPRAQTGVAQRAVAFDGARLFLAAADGLHAVSAATGERLWRHELDEPPTALPAVGGGRVYVGTDTEVHALDVAGTHRWTVDLEAPVGETLAVTDGRLLAVASRGSGDEAAVVSLA